ncbi:MAG TPA: flagellar assembly protein FliW [Ktedonobacterales bacterium]|nr:flagellar assembly protein FliW [Ktedonobacterales bacterium]
MEQHALAPAHATRATRKAAGGAGSAPPSEALEIVFPQGLIGCPDWRRFMLRPDPFEFAGELISVDEPGVSLLVADPSWLRARLSFELNEEDADALQLASVEDARVLTVLTIYRDPPTIIANLAGPLVINWPKRIGHQVVLDHHAYPLRAPVLAGEAARAVIETLITDDQSANVDERRAIHHSATSPAKKGA